MNLLKIFQRIKWQILAKLNPNYYVFSDKDVSSNEQKYQQSGQNDVRRYILEDNNLKDFLKDSKSKTCLEFGCGNGRMTQFLAEIFKQVYAIDISQEMINSAKKRLSHLSNISYLIEDGQKIDLDDNSMDFIFSYIVLQHLPIKNMVKETLKEFHRIIKGDGLVKIQVRGVPAYGGIFRYFKWYYGVSFSEEEINNILKEIGFEVINAQGQGGKLFWLTLRKI